MSDLISRQAAIDAIESIGSLDTNADREYARSVFETLPSAQPEIEPKTGRWIDITVGDVPAQACDQCKTFYRLTYTGGKHHYCPNCGAKMEGEVK